MAGNLKGQGGIKGLALQHGEKVAVGLVALVVLWLVYKATTLPHLEEKYQAGKLREAISATSTAISNATWPDAGTEQANEVHSYKPLGEKADVAIDSTVYKNENYAGFDSTPIAATTLRGDPTILNAV